MHTPGRTPLNQWSACRRGRYPHNTQQTQETNIHALGRIRIRDPTNQAAADQRLRPHDHPDRPMDKFNFTYNHVVVCMLSETKKTSYI
jgi:hypothetical protein